MSESRLENYPRVVVSKLAWDVRSAVAANGENADSKPRDISITRNGTSTFAISPVDAQLSVSILFPCLGVAIRPGRPRINYSAHRAA